MQLIVFQFGKYLVIGLVSNLSAYLAYLGLVYIGLAPLFGISIIYLISGSLSFILNKQWTFQSNSAFTKTARRYLYIQCLGFISNLAIFSFLHYFLALPHYISQFFGIGFVAIELFLLSRYYVFD